jgi:CHAT domain-containing protein/tetratricopeptide (TPR) repeat protein
LDGLHKQAKDEYIKGQLQSADNLWKQGLDRAEAFHDIIQIAKFLNNLGAVNNELGNYNKAIEYSARALSIRETIGIQADIAFPLLNLGNVYRALGQTTKALDYYNRGLNMLEKVGNQVGVAGVLNNLGRVYSDLGQNNRALDYYSRAYVIRLTIGDQSTIADTLVNLGVVHRDLGEYAKALECTGTALAIYKKIHTPERSATATNNIGTVYFATGQNDKALDYFNRALSIYEKIGKLEDIAETINNLGDVYHAMGKNNKAFDCDTRALVLFEKVGNRTDVIYALENLGSVATDLGRLDEAEKRYAESRRMQELVSLEVSDPSQVGALQESYNHFYERYANLLLKRNKPHDALIMLEAGRGQGLSRQAAANGFDFTRALLPSEAAQIRQKGSDVSADDHLFRAAQDQLYNEPPGSTHLALLQNQKDLAQNKLEEDQKRLLELRDRLTAKYPQYRALAGAAVPTAAQFTVLAANHPNTIYLVFAPVDEKSTLVGTLSKLHGIKFQALPIGEKLLRRQVAEWRSSIGMGELKDNAATSVSVVPPDNGGRGRGPQFEGRSTRNTRLESEHASTLYKELITPLIAAGILPRTVSYRQSPNSERGISHLCFVTADPLVDLPFGALRDSHGQRLIERFVISNSICLGTYFWPPNPRISSATLLCAADPIGVMPERSLGATAADPPRAVASGTRDAVFRSDWRGDYVPLPEARNEGRAVAALFTKSLFVAGPEAKKAKVVSELPRYDILHFATHGYLDAKDGMRSGLILAQENRGTEEDTVLNAREIASLPLAAEMAVLSACHTGQGQSSSGEGVLGLAWAFRAAGVPCVVASQWSVDDAATKEWMLTFYGALKAGKPKDDAVQVAMLAVKKTHPSPYYWAAFELIGDATPLRVGLGSGK